MKKRNIFKHLSIIALTLILTGFANNSFAQSLRFESSTGPTSKTICQGNTQYIWLSRITGYSHYLEYSLNGSTWNNPDPEIKIYTSSYGIFDSYINYWNPSYQTMYFRIRYYKSGSPLSYSNTVTLSFQAPTLITTEPNSTSAVEGGNASFSVSATNATFYKWQVSTDGGSSYTNITSAGTNPTYSGWTIATLNLSGVAATNNNYQYRCIVGNDYCKNDTSNSVTLTVTTSCIAPITQASNISFSTIDNSSGTLQWNNGSGTGRIVFVNTTNSFIPPTNGDNPSANSVYGGTGQQCVYNGNGSSVTVTGLTEGTTYYARIYEFDCTGRLYNMNTAASNPNPFSIFACVYPTAQATSFTSTPYGTGTIINWTRGDGDKRLVFVNTTNSFTMPLDGNNYTANPTYSGIGQQCVYNGVGNSVDVKGLNPNTTYYFAVYEFNIEGPCYLANPLIGSATTTATNPKYIITSLGEATYSGAFNGNANSTIYLCNSAGIQLFTNLPDTNVGGVNYPMRWQTSFDGVSWFTGSAYPPSTNTADWYIRACQSRLGTSSTDIYNPTPWVHIVHSPYNKDNTEAPTNCTYTYKDGDTYFTVSWTPSVTVDNTGGGLTVKHFLGYTTNSDYSGMTWVDVTGLTSYTVTGITPGVTYYWRLYAQTYNVGTNKGDAYCGAQPYTTCSLTSSLPINLISLNANFDDSKVIVSWATASEINNMSFIIERSTNAKDWQVIGTVNGSGNSNHVIEYYFEDNDPINGVLYYRLKQVDFNGKYKYYGPVSVNCYDIKSDGLSVYPNPASESVFISGNTHSQAEIVLYNIYGDVVASYISNDISVPTAISLVEFEKGFYFVAVKIKEKSKFFKIVHN